MTAEFLPTTKIGRQNVLDGVVDAHTRVFARLDRAIIQAEQLGEPPIEVDLFGNVTDHESGITLEHFVTTHTGNGSLQTNEQDDWIAVRTEDHLRELEAARMSSC